MEQAVNLFNEGLLSDTNPMILGNKTLTDCLNGTLVTMNGNEIALQNDMGNIRIDNAYLPSGYEPVGIKEYGGVIYIAAYNPITNKSQIGSFPSPERRIDVEEEDSGSFDFNNFSSPNNKEESSDLGIIVLKDDSRLIPLTYDDKTLHVGDKFVVYSEKLSELKDQISNYNNVNNTNINNTSFSKWKECTIDEYNVISDNNLKTIKYYKKENESSDWEECSLEEYNNIQDINLKAFKYCRREYVYKVYSPKNKKYTLSLGVLNEQNNFNDITSSLVRWNNVDYWKEVSIGEYNQELNEENKKQENNKYYIKILVGNIIKDLEDKSDLYKFNVGYFIPDSFIKDKDVDGQTISDTKLISERKKIAANTFSYKLSGPLYLKVNYNHVSNFYCNITGKNIPGNQIELTLTARFTYNCPDTSKNVTYEPNEGDDDYYTYEILKNGIDIDPNLIGFDFFVNDDNKSSNITPIYKDFSYDKFNDVYYVTEELEIVLDIPEDHILEYVIGVKSGLSHNKTIYTDEKEISYIKGLSYKGTINTDLLNSGELNLTLYRFYNNSKSKDSILQLGFEAYPKERESFENLTLTFENIDSNKTSDLGVHYLYTKQPLINGQQIINFNFEKSLVDMNGEEFPLQERSTYEVHIKYDHKIGEESTTKTYEEIIDRWFLTTELFNDLYITNLSDYCNPELTDSNELFLNKLKIAPNDDNIKSLYGIYYGNITYYDPEDPNVDTNISPMYRISNSEASDSLTLYQPIEFKKYATSGELDNSKYPEYVGTLNVEISGEDERIINSETIEKISYEALDVVYRPLRTVLNQRSRIDKTLSLLAWSNDSADYHPWGMGTDGEDGSGIGWYYYNGFFTSTNPWVNNTLILGDGDETDHSWPENYGFNPINTLWEAEDDSSISLLNFEDLNKYFTDIDKFKNFCIPIYFRADTGSSILSGLRLLGGPCFILYKDNNLIDIVFVKDNPFNELSEFLINWDEEIASSSVYKIIGNIPAIKENLKNITYSIQLNSSIDININLPKIGNLIFNLDTTKYLKTQSLYYHNKQIIEEYMRYKNKNSDKYVNINTGEKIINNDIVQESNNFIIKNYSVLISKKQGHYTEYLAHSNDDEGASYIKGYTTVSNY